MLMSEAERENTFWGAFKENARPLNPLISLESGI